MLLFYIDISDYMWLPTLTDNDSLYTVQTEREICFDIFLKRPAYSVLLMFYTGFENVTNFLAVLNVCNLLQHPDKRIKTQTRRQSIFARAWKVQ